MRHVQPGEPLNIPAPQWNGMLNLLERSDGAGPGRSGGFRNSVTCEIRNDTGQDLPRFGLVGLGDPLILPSDNEDEFLRRVILSGELIDAESAFDLKWGITLQPILNNQYGIIVVQGLCYAKLDDNTATTAAPKDGSIDTLTKADCGLARVIWRATGSGAQWAIVCLG